MKKFMFHPKNKEVQDFIVAPKTSKFYYPEWMKSMQKSWIASNGRTRLTATGCAPFTDSFTHGYIQELPYDVTFTFDEKTNTVLIKHEDQKHSIISQRGNVEGMPNMLPSFEGFYDIEFSWETAWEPITPKGYSTIYTHPLNRPDLPFYTFSGVIDTDSWSIPGPIPFIIKKGFTGTLPKGTPIVQMIFIKRDDWTAEISDFNEDILNKQSDAIMDSSYKKTIWTRKKFY